MNIKATYNQALIDIALQGAGNVDTLMQVAQLNGLSITDDLTAGAVLITPDADVDKQKIQAYFNQLANFPCSNGLAVAITGLMQFIVITPALSKNNLRIQEGQEIIDMALQGCGDVTRLFEVAAFNGLSITDEPDPGTLINTPGAALSKKSTATFFNSNPNYPASGDNGGISNTDLEGIGYWYTTAPDPATIVK